MDALKMAAVEPAGTGHELETGAVLENSEINLTPRMRTAIAALLEAAEYARDLDASPWDFAIEISSLRKLKLSNSDLRWLVVRGFVDHAIEITLGGDSQRSFRHPTRLLFSKKTCFVLTQAGTVLARDLRGRGERRTRSDGRSGSETSLAVVGERTPLVPKWDRDRHELYVGSNLVKQFKIPANYQESILAAFEEKNWPARIDDPLATRSEPRLADCLKTAIELLNEHQKRPLIRFLQVAESQQVAWELCGDQEATSGT